MFYVQAMVASAAYIGNLMTIESQVLDWIGLHGLEYALDHNVMKHQVCRSFTSMYLLQNESTTVLSAASQNTSFKLLSLELYSMHMPSNNNYYDYNSLLQRATRGHAYIAVDR